MNLEIEVSRALDRANNTGQEVMIGLWRGKRAYVRVENMEKDLIEFARKVDSEILTPWIISDFIDAIKNNTGGLRDVIKRYSQEEK